LLRETEDRLARDPTFRELVEVIVSLSEADLGEFKEYLDRIAAGAEA
jgi:hypothetical protein